MTPDVSIIVVSWNTRDLLADCLASIFMTVSGPTFDVYVVDNASTDGTVAMLRQGFPEVKLICNARNYGFAHANNQGISASRGRYVLLLNSDAMLAPGSLQTLINLGDAVPRAGILGARLVNPDGTFQASYTHFPGIWQEFLILSSLGRLLHGHYYPSQGPHEDEGPCRVDYVEGACMLARRSAIQAAGALDEGYFMYAEDVDWCLAMKKHGWQVWYQPEATIIHSGGGSSRQRRPQREADLYRSRVRFFRKHYGGVSAFLLKSLIYGATAVKIAMHSGLRMASRGRYGRPIVGMNDLIAALREY